MQEPWLIAATDKEVSSVPDGSVPAESLAERFQALLSIAESITSCRRPEDLFRHLAEHLQRVVRFDFLGLALYSPERDVRPRVRILEAASMDLRPRRDAGVDDTPLGWMVETQRPLMIADTTAETRWPRAMEEIRKEGIGSFCCLPLTTVRGRLGAFGFGRREQGPYTAGDVEFIGEVAKLVAVAVENVLNLQGAQAMQRQLAAERDHLRLLLDVTNALASNLDLSSLIATVSAALQRTIPHEFTALALHDPEHGDLVLHAAALRSGDGHGSERRRLPIASSPSGRAFATRRTQVFSGSELTIRFAEVSEPLNRMGIRALCCVPLIVGDSVLGTLVVGSVQPDAITASVVARIEGVARQVAMAVANALAFQKIAQLRDKLAEERLYLESEIRTDRRFEEIIGDSRALRRTFQEVEVVAPTDSTVLLLGETGTGKELMARAIHDRSRRSETNIRQDQLRRHSVRSPRKRALWSREGRVHWRHRAEDRALPGSRRWDPVSRRARRNSPRAAAQAAPRPAGAGVRAPRRDDDDQGRCPPDRGHEPRPAWDGRGGPLPRRPLLPTERVPDPHSTASRACRGHSRARPLLRPASGSADESSR